MSAYGDAPKWERVGSGGERAQLVVLGASHGDGGGGIEITAWESAWQVAEAGEDGEIIEQGERNGIAACKSAGILAAGRYLAVAELDYLALIQGEVNEQAKAMDRRHEGPAGQISPGAQVAASLSRGDRMDRGERHAG